MYSFPERDRRSQTLTACSRFENKYIIHPTLLPAMRQFLLTVASVDPYTRPGESHEYSVCSLYLDTEDLRFYRQTRNGEKTRIKLRARTYSDAPDAPVFLEVKARINRVVTKRRVSLSRPEAVAVLSQEVRWWDVCRPNEQADNLEHFVTQMALTSCKPLVRVRYLREAYIGLDHEPVRVTFDTHLQYKPTFRPTLLHDGGGWMPVRVGGVDSRDQVHRRRARPGSSTSFAGSVFNRCRAASSREPSHGCCTAGSGTRHGRRGFGLPPAARGMTMNGLLDSPRGLRPAAAGRVAGGPAAVAPAVVRSRHPAGPNLQLDARGPVLLAVVHAVARHHGRRHHGPDDGRLATASSPPSACSAPWRSCASATCSRTRATRCSC